MKEEELEGEESSKKVKEQFKGRKKKEKAEVRKG